MVINSSIGPNYDTIIVNNGTVTFIILGLAVENLILHYCARFL